MVATEFSTRLNHCSGDHVFDAVGLDLAATRVRVVEAKVSRRDFLGDVKIFDERHGYAAVADACYLICPEGLIGAHELPSSWGLIYHCVDRSAVFWRDALQRRRKNLVARTEFGAARRELGDRYTHTRRVPEALIVVRRPRLLTPRHPLSREWNTLVRSVGRKLTRHYLGVAPDL